MLREFLRLLLLLSGLVHCVADGHDHSKDDQIPQAADAVAEDAGDDHEGTAAESQDGHDEPADHILLLLLAHPLDEDGEIHQIDGDDG